MIYCLLHTYLEFADDGKCHSTALVLLKVVLVDVFVHEVFPVPFLSPWQLCFAFICTQEQQQQRQQQSE
jgi:hypothetical protein